MTTQNGSASVRVIGQWTRDGSWQPALTVGHVWADGVWRPDRCQSVYINPEPFFWHPLVGWFG